MTVVIVMKVSESVSQLQTDGTAVRSHVTLKGAAPGIYKDSVFEAWVDGAAGAQAYTAGQSVTVTIGNPT